ncbi:MAG: hypothetical protein GY755_19415 [Chloroflexi bacterium]|nr:hypothetical protein [Chloroflexota bacterium]
MKKPLYTTLTLLFTVSLVIITVSPVGAASYDPTPIAPDEVGWTLTMSTVSFTGNGGAKLTFDVSGTPPSSINTLAYAGWNGAYPLNCVFNSTRGVLVCRIAGGIKKHGGGTAYFVLGEQAFTISIPDREPEPAPPKPPENCATSSTFEYFDFSISSSAAWDNGCLNSFNSNL